MKPVEGPTGPHLFRTPSTSSTSTQDVEFALSMSPPTSPRNYRAGPITRTDVYVEPRSEEVPQSSLPLRAWSSRQVAQWMVDFGFEDSLVEKFREHDISGAILQDLQFCDLKELGVQSFGQRHHLWNEIRSLRGTSIGGDETSPKEDTRCSPLMFQQSSEEQRSSPQCSSPPTPEDERQEEPLGRRRARRAVRASDVISPAESASIVAIEQLLPKPHVCSKGENCSKWRKQQRKLAKIAKEFPLELQAIQESYEPTPEPEVRPTSEIGPSVLGAPSVVASSDLLGPGMLPSLRLDEGHLRGLQSRDPQENVRQFLTFQHVKDSPEEPESPYEMFPPLSPPDTTQAPIQRLQSLAKLTIPAMVPQDAFSPNRTVVQRTPATAIQFTQRHSQDNFWRNVRPASEVDIPVTQHPIGPIERDVSQSVPPDMHFGTVPPPFTRSNSRAAAPTSFRMPDPVSRPSTSHTIQRSTSRASSRRPQPAFAITPIEEAAQSPTTNIPDTSAEKTPQASTSSSSQQPGVNHSGWMKKRKTKMLRHEWHENHFRLNGTTLAMHRDSRAIECLEAIDVDEYAVACTSLASSNKLGAAFKSLKFSGGIGNKKGKGKDGGKDDVDPAAFAFQLVPTADGKGEKKASNGFLHAATGKTHHFSVKDREERIDWMRELMLAKALKQRGEGVEIKINGQVV